jgi:hypothetical protein
MLTMTPPVLQVEGQTNVQAYQQDSHSVVFARWHGQRACGCPVVGLLFKDMGFQPCFESLSLQSARLKLT